MGEGEGAMDGAAKRKRDKIRHNGGRSRRRGRAQGKEVGCPSVAHCGLLGRTSIIKLHSCNQLRLIMDETSFGIT